MILILSLVIGGCAAPAPAQPAPAPDYPDYADEAEAESPVYEVSYPTSVFVIDQAGRQVVIEGPVERIISGFYISSSAVIALGLEDRMVGIEARADVRPIYALAAPQLIDLPSVGTAREFNLEGAIALEPDLAILPIRQLDNAEIMAELGIPVILVEPETPEKLMEMIALIAGAAGVPERAQELIDFYTQSLAEVSRMTAGITERPVVYMAGVGSYLRTAPRDMYQSSMIELAGGISAGADIEGRGWMDISYEQLLVMNPDVIIIPSDAGYDREDIMNNPQLAQLAAVQSGRVYQMPGAFEAWDSPVPSFTLGIRWLLSVLHEDVYSLDEMREYAADFYARFFGIEIDTALIDR